MYCLLQMIAHETEYCKTGYHAGNAPQLHVQMSSYPMGPCNYSDIVFLILQFDSLLGRL